MFLGMFMQGMQWRHFFGAFFWAFFLFGCTATKVATQAEDQDVLEDNSQGYLLIGVVNNYSLDGVLIWGEIDLKLTPNDLSAGENYFLVPVPAGNYRIGQINYSSYVRIKLDDAYWSFSVKPSTINYVGHLNVKRSAYYFFADDIELKNQAVDALEYMETYYPTILSDRALIYGGPGNDFFYSFVAGLGADE